NGSDVLYHVYRVAEMDRSWSQGILLPTWADGLYFGYGSPLWHFYAPLAYLITSVLTRLFDLSALEALRWLLMGTYLLMGMGMYLFMKQRAGKLAGLIAAIVYLYSPYLIYTEPYARGTYPEMLAFALFPVVLWRFEILIHELRGRAVLLAGLSLLLLILSHNLMALVLTALLAGWILWHMVADMTVNLDDALDRYLPVWGTLIAGVALSAFFWMPILLESETVSLDNLTGVELLNYQNFFVQLGDLVAFMPLPDTGAINGLENVYRFGVPQWVFALTGLLSTVFFIGQAVRAGKRDDPLLRQGIFFALGAIVLIFLMTPASGDVWAALRPLAFLQFPWRLLGVVALCF
ncbi:MAG: 6-pyruvoyl-tetrahydropterin synthase-related protein, partial [Aggregatilineales bacterium]